MPHSGSFRVHGLADLNPRRILLCQLRQIGDVVLLTPAIHMLKKRYPDARIDVYTEKKCAPVLEQHPEVGHVWRLDKGLGLLADLRFYREVGRGPDGLGYDLIIDFQQLPRIRWMLMFARCAVKLSTPPPWYNLPFYTHWAPGSGPYAAKCKAGVLMSGLGIPWNNDPPRIYLSAAERERAAGQLASWGLGQGDTLVTVDPTHRRVSRCWPAGHYARLLALAAQARPDARFLLLYGPGEEGVVRQVAQGAGLGSRVIVPRDMLSLREMAALLERARLHLGNCSSPRHFAVAVGTPTLTLRGSTSGAWTYPGPGQEDLALGLDCQPCSEGGCARGLRCLTELTPEMALPRLLQLMEGRDKPVLAGDDGDCGCI
ncbi:MAG: glycosyltransferase family 9 protein [Proteobacteria bacterium]|nr:glycosyltransferase family 9 protein [Pseudomonadota bacterium]MBU1596117.1 glycosyltransferase family 9 protein [Pseudomonadota bacterium]